jgi:ADP-ribose pyrophosphatase YjhB (NUDIX family)
VTDPAAKFATPRVSAGALFVDDGQVLLVHKTYGNGWDIPGGYVDIGESPAAACRRELLEEIGLDRPARQLLVVDWAPSDGEGDKILYVFDCGQVGDVSQIELRDGEIDRWSWVPVSEVADYTIPRLARRLTWAYEARNTRSPIYLEHGTPAFG